MSSLEYPEERGEASGQRLEANAARPGIVLMWRTGEWAKAGDSMSVLCLFSNWKLIF